MRLITLARTLLWSACIGGILVFLIEYDPAREKVLSLLSSFWKEPVKFDAKSIKEYKDYIDIWQGVSAVMVGIGSFIAREYHNVEKKLNGTWFWVSIMQHNGKVTRVGRGEMTIEGIHNFKKRKEDPRIVLSGKVKADSGKPTAANSVFHATQIVVGQKNSQVIFYEWEYYDGDDARGVTKLRYDKTWETTFWMFKRASLNMSGRFMLDTAAGGGTIEFFKSDGEALAKYNGVVRNL
jgi:hypothetical protein